MGGVFAANMTGNTVLAGIALAEGRYPDAGRHLAPLVAFFIGAMLARLLLRLWHRPMTPACCRSGDHRRVGFLPLATESAVLVLALAMGLQASAITQFGGVAVSTVVVTSTLARTADAALDQLWPGEAGKLPVVATPRAADADLARLPGGRRRGRACCCTAWRGRCWCRRVLGCVMSCCEAPTSAA